MKAYKMRAYPTTRQAANATLMLRVHCDIYNACLQERRDAYRMCGVFVSYKMQSAQLKYIRQTDFYIGNLSFHAQQRTVKRIDHAFKDFFARCKRGETPGFPRFKPYQRFNTVEHTHGNGAKWHSTHDKWAKAYFQGIGHIKVSEHTRIEGKIKTLSLVRDGRKWFVIAVAETPEIILTPTGNSIGIDLGIARFATTSDGEMIENPHLLQEHLAELADLQQRYAASNRRSKQLRRKISKLHRKIKNQRLDFHHKTSRNLVNANDVLILEDLQVSKMMKANPARTKLNGNIADVGWAQFRTILTNKAESAGREIIFVNPAYTSINCCRCGQRGERPEQAVFVCAQCGTMDADLNGARNILGRGLASTNTPVRKLANCSLEQS
jgi:putative transposase